MIVSGSKDGSFCIWDTRFNQVPAVDPSNSNKLMHQYKIIFANVYSKGDLSRIPVYKPIKSVTAAHNDVKGQIKSSKKSGFQPLVKYKLFKMLWGERKMV